MARPGMTADGSDRNSRAADAATNWHSHWSWLRIVPQPCRMAPFSSTCARPHDAIRQQRVLGARSQTRSRPPASARRRDLSRPCRRISCATRRPPPRARARGFAPAPLSVQVNPDPAGGDAATHRHRQRDGDVLARLYRGAVQDRRHAARPRARRRRSRAIRASTSRPSRLRTRAPSMQRLAAAGFRMRPLIAMQRPVDTAGAPGTAAFTLARVEAGEMPEGRIQMLTHHTEDMVWQPRWLTHPQRRARSCGPHCRGRRCGRGCHPLCAFHRA